MGAVPPTNYSASSHHLSVLKEVVDNPAQASLLRSYQRSFNGFAVYLKHKAVVSVFKSRTLHTQTTRSWDFMGFSEKVNRNPSIESNVIIGVIDTGIWPESESFSDKNFGPVPARWKGACIGGRNFTCNKKLIGARYYNSLKSVDSARDPNGHGTHTASIAAGNPVKGASFYGLAQGTARGGVPSARIAAYRACDAYGDCNEADILAAFDDAIADGVDIISISIAYSDEDPVGQQSIEVGAFHAMERGVLTVAAAGNFGNSSGTVDNSMPWMLSVAASSIDRRLVDKLVLGNGKILTGPAVNAFHLNGSSFPLIRGRDATNTCTGKYSDLGEMCGFDCLSRELVKGKIVVCRDSEAAVTGASIAGATGSVIYNDAEFNFSTVMSIPVSSLSIEDFSVVEAYLDSTKKPCANILKSEVIDDREAPVVAPFSSRGPNTKIPEILKPDISAPGVAVLAAYSPVGSPSRDILVDKRSVNYSILSGTSMACPHVASAAAYVKSFHPKWSTSAIQSSLMTTAWRMDASKHPDAEFAYGSGHLNPLQAVNPGLVYETSKKDHLRLLCSIGYSNSKLRIISGDNSTICAAADTFTPKDLNYPAMTINITKNKPFTVSFPRTVTNVGLSNTTYKAHIFTNSQLNITVKPSTLLFKWLNEKQSFVVVATGKGFQQNAMQSASLVWSDGIHRVHSPIVIHTYSFPPA
ncbi:Subtilisin-like protease [Heracleum sosnowskyi]|uniref:Subtilisin-like protease n=1 Tax=Heracleum sosnowskyi TaxID=360622 RepID=A0AAD8GSW8_9APIA|nr:Subtilisin-like protease [Heracleum sosnowskyi]